MATGRPYYKIFNDPCFYICCIDVKQLPEYDQDRQKHVGVLTNRV